MSPSPAPFLLYEQRGAVVKLTMNQPERRNALTGNRAVEEFTAAVARIDADTSVRAVILTGAGPAFSSGGDVKEMARQIGPAGSHAIDGLTIRQDYRHGIQRLPLALFNLEVPVIAAVNGAAMGAGLDLACMCDMRIASTEAKFAESFVKLGLIAGDGGAWLLQRAIGPARAAEMSFTGDAIDAATALQWGLVSQVVPPEQLMPAAQALADRVAANPSHAVRMTKRLMREAVLNRLDSVLELAAVMQALAHQTPDHREAVTAFLEKRKPAFKA